MSDDEEVGAPASCRGLLRVEPQSLLKRGLGPPSSCRSLDGLRQQFGAHAWRLPPDSSPTTQTRSTSMVLKIALGILLGGVLLMVGCGALVAAGSSSAHTTTPAGGEAEKSPQKTGVVGQKVTNA